MSLLPKRLNELSLIEYDSDETSNANVRYKNKTEVEPIKLQPKRLHELYSDDELKDDYNCATEFDHSSGFNESVNDNETTSDNVSSSTPFNKENDKNYFSRNNNVLDTSPVYQFGVKKLCDLNLNERENYYRRKVRNDAEGVVANNIKSATTDLKSSRIPVFPLEPRSLTFSPVPPILPPKNTTHLNIENLFATPSIKPPLTTGRVIFSSSQHKQRKPQKPIPDYQKALFMTPQSIANPPSNTSDYVTDSFNSVKKTSMLSTFLSPIEEEKMSIDELLALRDSSDISAALKDKMFEINKKDYILKKKIGIGGSSVVFSAECKIGGEDCALKVVNLQTDASAVQGYLNETKLLNKLQGSDCVVKLFEYLHCPEKDALFMVMEMGETDLNTVLKGYQSHIPLNRIISYWHQMLQAVKYIHDHGIIHSDLKPANFLLVNGRLKLIDFGIASNISHDSTSIIKYAQTGTLNYISPEALIDTSTGNTPVKQNKYKISTKSDVWSLGCIFYLCVYRRTPFGHIKQFYAKYSVITNNMTEVDYPKLPMFYPPMLVEIIQKCLKFDPKERYTVAKLLEYPFSLVDESI